MGQTRAKKVLAVGVWNHYLRVASNERSRDADEASANEAEEAEAGQMTRVMRLGKFTTPDAAEKREGESWQTQRGNEKERREEGEHWTAQRRIEGERSSERLRDPHGEAVRGLMFGRAEREWLVNAGGPEALVKFGDDRRGKVKTPAEEAASQLEERKWSTDQNEGPQAAVGGERRKRVGVFGADEPLYFSSNTTSQGEKSGATREGATVEERTKRALRVARDRLSSTESPSTPTRHDAAPPSTNATSNTPPSTTTSHPPPPFLSPTPGNLPFFEKSNILLLGPSGSGKTLLLRTLAQALDVPFVHVDATPLTMAGYVGDDVESIIHRLLVEAGWDVERAQRGIVCIDEIDKLRKPGKGGGAGGKDVGGEGVQQALLRLLEGTVVQVPNKAGATSGGAAKGRPQTQAQAQRETTEEGAAGLGAWYNHRKAQNPKPANFNVDTSSILFVLSGAFVGVVEVIRKRLAPPAPSSPPSDASTTDASTKGMREWTQTDLLTRLEPTDLEEYGMIPEFIGRVPVSVVLNPLTFDDLVRVMTEPKNSLVDQYTSLFALNGIHLHISQGAVEEVVHRAMGTSSGGGLEGKKAGGGGARSLRRIMEEVLLDAFYESYGGESVKYVLVGRETVREGRAVGLYSRGQRFEFEARVRGEAEEYARMKRGEKEKASAGTGEKKHVELDPNRARQARLKARSLIRSRVRRTNRLVDPVIYI